MDQSAESVASVELVWRVRTTGGRVRLNPALIRSAGGARGGRYSWIDRRPGKKSGRYWLQALSRTGTVWYGPVTARA